VSGPGRPAAPLRWPALVLSIVVAVLLVRARWPASSRRGRRYGPAV